MTTLEVLKGIASPFFPSLYLQKELINFQEKVLAITYSMDMIVKFMILKHCSGTGSVGAVVVSSVQPSSLPDEFMPSPALSLLWLHLISSVVPVNGTPDPVSSWSAIGNPTVTAAISSTNIDVSLPIMTCLELGDAVYRS